MLNFLLQLSVALAGGAAYCLAMLGVLIGLDKLCRSGTTKPRAAAPGFPVVTRRLRWDDDGRRYRMN